MIAVRRSAPLALGLVVVLALAAVSLLLGRANLHAAESNRLQQRAKLTRQIGSYVATVYDPKKLRADVDRTPFAPGSPGLNELLLQQFQVNPAGDPNVVVALFDPRGRNIAARGSVQNLRVDMLGDAWSQALSGQVGEAQTFSLDGARVRAYTVPVGTGKPWAVLVAVPHDVSGQTFHQKLGAMGTGPGGLATVDARGIALTSWNPQLIGTHLLTADELTALRSEPNRQWYRGHGSDRTVFIAALDADTGYAQVFSQRTADLFRDLRTAQHLRDVALLAVLAVAILGLMLLGWQRERVARRAAHRLHAMLENAHDLVLVAKTDGTAGFVSPAIERLLGHSAAEWTGRPLLDLVHRGDADRVRALLDDPTDGRLMNVRLRAADGSVRWFDVESSDLTGDRKLSGVLLTCHDVAERKQLQDELSFQASHDELTGLANRAVFSEHIELALDGMHSSTGAGTGFAVLFIDLDHFKPVNDTLGHDAGDRVLQTVAARLSAAVRDGDLVCRFGGDEFGVLLIDADSETASEIAVRLVRAVRTPVAVNATLVNIDASIGITFADRDIVGGARSERLIREADEAMYLAKQAGRGRHAFYPGHRAGGAVPTPRSAPRATEEPEGTASVPVRASISPRDASPERRTLRDKLLHTLPLILAGAMVVGIAGLGSLQEARATSTAETKRGAERADVTARIAEYAASVTDPRRVMSAVNEAPWNLSDLRANSGVLEAFSHSPAAGNGSIVALAHVDGSVVATYPANAPVHVAPNDPAWSRARSGNAGFSWLTDPDTAPRAWYLLPVTTQGQIRAILLIGQSGRQSTVAKMIEAVGSLGLGDGGVAGIDPHGYAFTAWDQDLVGRRVLDTADLIGLPVGQVRRIDRNGQVILVANARAPGDPNLRYVAFMQRTNVFFGDLRTGQQSRNNLLIVLVCAAVVGLAVLNRRRELSEQRSRSRLQALLHNAHDLLITVDRRGATTFVSSAIEGLLGRSAASSLGRDFLDLVDPTDRARLLEALRTDDAGPRATVTITDVRLLGADDAPRWFDVTVADLRGNSAISGLLLTCHEVGERKRLQDELRHRARHDILTGLPNRATFGEHLQACTASADRSFAVLFIDLDHFKPINDRFGHDVGDAVLQAVAGRIDGVIRRSGRGSDDLVSRLGGDEFAVVLRDTGEPEARTIADGILAAIRTPIPVASGTVRVGATIGIAFSDPDATSDLRPETVVARADSAMYQAKAAGRDRYAVFSS